LVSNPLGQFNEDHILKELITPESEFLVDDLVLCASNFSCGFISSLIQERLFPARIHLALIHPDLLIDGLNISNHTAGIRFCGYLHALSTAHLIQPQYLDPASHSVKNLPSEQIMTWGWIDENSSLVAQVFQIPFYTPFLAKGLRGLINNSLNTPFPEDKSFCFGITTNGLLFFGLQ